MELKLSVEQESLTWDGEGKFSLIKWHFNMNIG
jgi:hypothetical protein